MRVIRWALVVVLAIFIFVVYSSGTSPVVSFQQIEAAYTESGLLGDLEQEDARQLERFMGITPAMAEELLYWKSPNPMSADELLIVKAKDEDSLAQIQELIDQRIEDQGTTFGDYAPDEVRKLNNAVVTRRGDFLIYGVGDGAGEWETVFNGLQ